MPAPKPSSTLSVATVQSGRIAEESSELHHIAQLRFNQPALSKADIVKLALKEAIHKVESKAACKSRTETTEPLPAIPPAGTPIGGAQAVSGSPRRNRADTPSAEAGAVLPDVRDQLLSGRSSLEKQAVKGFRDVVREVHDFDAVTAKAPKTARQREAYEEEALQYLPAEEPAASSHSLPSRFELGGIRHAARTRS